MNSSKAVTNARKMSQFTRTGMISLMALGLSAGQIVFAADIKLWWVGGDSKGKVVEHIADSEKESSIKLLSDLKKADIEKFVESSSKNPLAFMEGVKEAWAKVKKDRTSDELKKFKEGLIKSMTDLEAKKFGGEGEKAALIRLVKNMFDLGLDDSDLMDKVFGNAADRLALNVTTEEPKKEEGPKEKPVNPVVGEQTSDAQLEAMAKQVCDSLNGKISGKDAELQKLLKEMGDLKNAFASNKDAADKEKEALRAAFADEQAKLSRLAEQAAQVDPNALNNQQKERDAADVINGLLGNLLNQDQNRRNNDDQVQPNNNSTPPFFPPQSSKKNDESPLFNNPLPEQQQPQPEQPFFMPPTFTTGVQVPVHFDLPSNTGRADLKDAQAIASENEMRQPVAATLSPQAGLPDLVLAKAKISSDIKRSQVALQNAKERASTLDEQLEALKDGGRAALSSGTKQRLAQLKADVDTKKAALDNQKQAMSMAAPEQRTSMQGMLSSAQQELQRAEQSYNQFNQQVEVAIEEANGQIKALAKVRDNLNSAATKLQSQIASMKEDETAVQQLINQNMQMQLQALNPQGGTSNINRIQQRGNGGGRSTGRLPSQLGGALQSGKPKAAAGTSGNYVRPSLSK